MSMSRLRCILRSKEAVGAALRRANQNSKLSKFRHLAGNIVDALRKLSLEIKDIQLAH
jgi:hypothetical protein